MVQDDPRRRRRSARSDIGQMTGMVSDEQLADILAPAGWHPSRRVNIDEARGLWLQRGHTASEAAVNFASEFDGITFKYPRHKPADGEYQCSIDAILAARSIHPSVVRSYEERVHEPLCPVGLAASGHVVLMISPSGKIFGGYDAFLALYGETGREAIWNIFHRIKGAVVSG